MDFAGFGPDMGSTPTGGEMVRATLILGKLRCVHYADAGLAAAPR